MERLAHLCEQWLRPLRARPQAGTLPPPPPAVLYLLPQGMAGKGAQ